MGVFLLQVVLQPIQVHPTDTLLWEQILHERYCIKSNTSLEMSLGLTKRDEIISLYLFHMELSFPVCVPRLAEISERHFSK